MDNSQPTQSEEEKLIEAPEEEPLLKAPEEEKLIPAHTSHTNSNLVKVILGIIGVLILLAVAFTAYLLVSDTTSTNPDLPLPVTPTESVSQPPVLEDEIQTACTMDAKLCPDGSAVGREGPNCEFAACPGE